MCHNAKVVHAFEASTPFEKITRHSNHVPRLNLHSVPAALPVPHFPRFRALALFGRRPPQRVDSLVMPASENLHNKRHLENCTSFVHRITVGVAWREDFEGMLNATNA